MGKKVINKIRIKDIAERAGVSPGTVDRVIHKRGEVSLETSRTVMDIINEMHYSPNMLASTLASSRRVQTAVIIPSASSENPFWADHLKGVNRAGIELSPYGFELDLYTFSMSDTVDFRNKTDKLLRSKPDCILIAPVFFHESVHFLGKCKKKKIPFAFIDTTIEHFEPVCFIGQNSCQSGAVAAKLLRLGNNPSGRYLIFNITRERDQLSHLGERERGFRLYFENRGETPEIITKDIHDDPLASVKSEIVKYQSNGNVLNGIFVTGSKVHLVAQALESLGMQQIRLVGYDLVEKNKKFLRKDLIHFLISQQPEEQAYLGIKSLFDFIVMKREIPVVQMPIDIITRENLNHYPKCH